MLHKSRELWWSLFAIILITLLYVAIVVYSGSIPAASNFFGHSLGVIGFILMLMTETLYSFRKRSRSARWGRTAAWLQLHIFTGLVGPYLVLLHTSWKFNGLAGVVMLLTAIIVASGFVGRYIFTAIPRSADGTLIEVEALQNEIASSENELKTMMGGADKTTSAYGQQLRRLSRSTLQSQDLNIVFGRVFTELRFKYQAWKNERSMQGAVRSRAIELDALFRKRRTLQRQVRSIATARRMLSIWHAVHIPLGVALFSSAIVHIIAAIYYATLLH